MGGPFPELEISSPRNDQIITNLMHFLEQRINKRNILRTDLQQKRKNIYLLMKFKICIIFIWLHLQKMILEKC